MDFNNQNHCENGNQNNQPNYQYNQNAEQYNQLKNELEEIKKRNKSNQLIMVLLLIATLFLVVFSTCMYMAFSNTDSTNPTNDNGTEKPSESVKKNITASYCYKNKLIGAPGMSEACKQEEDCSNSDTIYNKQVLRLNGDTEGVKKFNQKLEGIVENYAWDTDTKKYADYTCNPITDKNLMTGVSIDYYDEIYQLSDKYIVLRVNISHRGLMYAGGYSGVNEIFIFDIESDKEITKEEFIKDLKEKYNILLKMSCGDPSSAEYVLKNDKNEIVNSTDLASAINNAFGTSYDGDLLNKLIIDMYFNTDSTNYIFKKFRTDEDANKNDYFYQFYSESRCSEQETM